MRRVIIESPYSGDVETHLRYLDACMRDCLLRGEAPFASHRLYPGVLDDGKKDERALGIRAGLVWGDVAAATVVYIDLGITKGMREGIAAAVAAQRPIEYRSLSEWRTRPAA